jgi:hypothetical protein
MNERIQKLYIQVVGDDKLNFDSYLAEKFAELIVKECAHAIVNDSRLNDVRSAANGCVRTINEHFGVEK